MTSIPHPLPRFIPQQMLPEEPLIETVDTTGVFTWYFTIREPHREWDRVLILRADNCISSIVFFNLLKLGPIVVKQNVQKPYSLPSQHDHLLPHSYSEAHVQSMYACACHTVEGYTEPDKLDSRQLWEKAFLIPIKNSKEHSQLKRSMYASLVRGI